MSCSQEAPIPLGVRCSRVFTVEEVHSAQHVRSGTVNVLSTPSMIAFIEETALGCIQGYLPQGHTSVGTHVNVKHVRAVPIGASVTVEVEVVQVEGRRVVFSAKVYWGGTVVGEGTHERYIVDVERFLAKVAKHGGK